MLRFSLVLIRFLLRVENVHDLLELEEVGLGIGTNTVIIL